MEQAKSMLQNKNNKFTSQKLSFHQIRNTSAKTAHHHRSGEPNIVDWILGDNNHDGDSMVNEIDNERYMDAITLAMSLPAMRVKRGKGIVFGHHFSNHDQDESARKLKSHLLFTEFDPKKEFGSDGSQGTMYRDTMMKLQQISWFLKTRMEDKNTAASECWSASLETMMERMDHLGDELKRFHKKYGPSNDKHWYVANAGVVPEHQGQGFGQELMDQLCEMADATGNVCYAESVSEESRMFYEKSGFKEVGREMVVGPNDDDDGLKLMVHIMVREPRYGQRMTEQ